MNTLPCVLAMAGRSIKQDRMFLTLPDGADTQQIANSCFISECQVPAIICSIKCSLVSLVSVNLHFFTCSQNLATKSLIFSKSFCLYFVSGAIPKLIRSSCYSNFCQIIGLQQSALFSKDHELKCLRPFSPASNSLIHLFILNYALYQKI